MCCHIHLILFAFISAIIRLGCVSCKIHLKLKMSVTIHALILLYAGCLVVYVFLVLVAFSTDFYSFAQFICLHSCNTGVLLHRLSVCVCIFLRFYWHYTKYYACFKCTLDARFCSSRTKHSFFSRFIYLFAIIIVYLCLFVCVCVTNKRTNIILKWKCVLTRSSFWEGWNYKCKCYYSKQTRRVKLPCIHPFLTWYIYYLFAMFIVTMICLCWCILFYFAHLLFSVQNIHRWTWPTSEARNIYKMFTQMPCTHGCFIIHTDEQSLYLHWFKYQFKNTLDWIHSVRITKFSWRFMLAQAERMGCQWNWLYLKWRLNILCKIQRGFSATNLLFWAFKTVSSNFNGV